MYPTYTPKWKWSVGVQYEIRARRLRLVTPRVDAATRATSTPTPPTALEPDRRLHGRQCPDDLAQTARTSIAAEVTNLFDKYYLLTVFDLTIAGAGVASGQPGRPREWAVTVKKKF